LSDLFQNEDQDILIIQHFMFGTQSDHGCPSCSFWHHGFNGSLPYINLRVNFAAVAKAPPEKLKPFYESQKWSTTFLSSCYNTFNRDMGAELEVGGYHEGQLPGLTVFVKKENAVYRTYNTFERGIDLMNTVHHLLDMTPTGRQGLNESLHSPPFYPAEKLNSHSDFHIWAIIFASRRVLCKHSVYSIQEYPVQVFLLPLYSPLSIQYH